MVTIAVIPARGGSTRVPRKNLADFGGRPLLARTIEAAQASTCIDEVYVSSDDLEILSVAESLGANHFGVRERYADNFSPSSHVTIDVVAIWERTHGVSPNSVVQLLPTCPLRGADDIDKFIRGSNGEASAGLVMSVAKPIGLNPNWRLQTRRNGRISPVNLRDWGERSQDLPVNYFLTGSIWAGSPDLVKRFQGFRSPETTFQEISWLAGFDIDDFDDLSFARTLLAARS